mmetsp:Transcript_15772/g.18200  ORF Transcript_15772/g.18200 Transcript_15772/m.18200 type:complete len:93 (-) Transcript_15772:472-750(-)
MDWALSTPAKSPSSPYRGEDLSGKLVSVGGENAGTVNRRGGVCLVKLDTSDFAAGFCGGIIGKVKAQKMCIKQDCKIHMHAQEVCVIFGFTW